jgi:hypothetical protein
VRAAFDTAGCGEVRDHASCRGPSGPDLEGQLADCDPKLAKYRAALDAGADPARNWLQGDRHDRVSRQWTRPRLSVIASQLS